MALGQKCLGAFFEKVQVIYYNRVVLCGVIRTINFGLMDYTSRIPTA